MSHACNIKIECSNLVPPPASLLACQLFDSLCASFTSSSSMCRLARTQQCAKLRACSCRLQSGILTAVKLAKVGTAEAYILQREAKLYQHCKQLQYQMLPGVLAAGPAMAGAAYLLATCLLPVVGFSDCSSAKYQALHAVKALHGRRGLHGYIRESNILCISMQNKSARLYS